MSAFAGIFFKKSDPRRDQRIQNVRAAVTAHSAGRNLAETVASHGALWKLDFGAFGVKQLTADESAGLLAVAGHPYVDAVTEDDRTRHLAWLRDVLDRDEVQKLERTRGSYALIYAPNARRELFLATDCLNVRPLYYMEDAEAVVFSTNVQTFERLPGFDGGLDERGAIEESVFGFSLGDRTKYGAVKCLTPGEVLRFSDTGKRSHVYWRWNGESADVPYDDNALHNVFESFQSAIRVRRASDRRAMAFLTGGMDSRSVAASLRQQGVELNTLNFAPEGSQDLVFGAQLGKSLKTNHMELPLPLLSVAEKISTVIPKWIAQAKSQGLVAERPRLVWSGDGGSVGLGHVYLNDRLIDVMESGNRDAALSMLLAENRWRVTQGIIPADKSARLAEIPLQGMREELSKVSCKDPGRALHILLMLTDQRHHLHGHYERIYTHECELHLPFFDRDFLRCVLSYPVRPFLAHRFYNKWLNLFSNEVRSVPWQAYPGHEPCPVPVPDGLTYQWGSGEISKKDAAILRRKVASTALRDIRDGRYDRRFVDTKRLYLVALLTYFGIKDYRYALRFANVLKTIPGI